MEETQVLNLLIKTLISRITGFDNLRLAYVGGQSEAYVECLRLIGSYKQVTRSAKKANTSKNAEFMLSRMISELCDRLNKLNTYKKGDRYVEGLRVAYVESLEIIQLWSRASEHGLNFEIEARYRIV